MAAPSSDHLPPGSGSAASSRLVGHCPQPGPPCSSLKPRQWLPTVFFSRTTLIVPPQLRNHRWPSAARRINSKPQSQAQPHLTIPSGLYTPRGVPALSLLPSPAPSDLHRASPSSAPVGSPCALWLSPAAPEPKPWWPASLQLLICHA